MKLIRLCTASMLVLTLLVGCGGDSSDGAAPTTEDPAEDQAEDRAGQDQVACAKYAATLVALDASLDSFAADYDGLEGMSEAVTVTGDRLKQAQQEMRANPPSHLVDEYLVIYGNESGDKTGSTQEDWDNARKAIDEWAEDVCGIEPYEREDL